MLNFFKENGRRSRNPSIRERELCSHIIAIPPNHRPQTQTPCSLKTESIPTSAKLEIALPNQNPTKVGNAGSFANAFKRCENTHSPNSLKTVPSKRSDDNDERACTRDTHRNWDLSFVCLLSTTSQDNIRGVPATATATAPGTASVRNGRREPEL